MNLKLFTTADFKFTTGPEKKLTVCILSPKIECGGKMGTSGIKKQIGNLFV